MTVDVNPTNTVNDDLATSAPVDNGPLSERDADERLTALLGGNPETDPDDEEVGNSEADPAADDTTDEPTGDEDDIDPAALSEDEGTQTQEDDDTSEAYSAGRFASDDAKVTLEDGTTISVAELKRGHLFQRDYTKKTTELAEKSKAVEAKEAEYSQAQNDLKAREEWALFVLQQYGPQQPQRPTVSATQDPVAWLTYQEDVEKYNQAVNAWQAMNQGREAEQTKAQKEAQAKASERVQSEIAALQQAYPQLKDPAKSKAWFDDTQKAAEEYFGITAEEFQSIGDHRMMRVLRSGIMAERARRKAPDVKKEVQRKPPVAQGSGPRQNPQASARREVDGLRKSLRETGSVASADAYLAQLLK